MISDAKRLDLYNRLSPAEKRAVDMGIYKVEDYFDMSLLPNEENTFVLDANAAPVIQEPRETTAAEFGKGLLADFMAGSQELGSSVLDIGVTAADLVGADDTANSIRKGSQFFDESANYFRGLAPEAYRQEKESGQQAFGRDEAGDITFDPSKLSAEAVVGTTVESLPQIPAFLGLGGLARTAVTKVLPWAGKGLQAFLGYGAANAAMVAPSAAEDVRAEALRLGASEEEANDARNFALASIGALSSATGGTGGALSAAGGKGAQSLLGAVLRGGGAEAPFEVTEEAGQSALTDLALGRDIDAARALNAGTMAAGAGTVSGGTLGGLEYVGARSERLAQAASDRELKANEALEEQRRVAEFASRSTENARIADAFMSGKATQGEFDLGIVDEPSVGGAAELEAAAATEQRFREGLGQRRRDAVSNDLAFTAIEQPDNVMAQALATANRGRALTDAVDITSPAQTAPQAEPEQGSLLFNDPQANEIEAIRREVAEDTKKREEADALARQRRAEQVTMQANADRRSFTKDLLTANPNATQDEVLNAQNTWQSTRDTLNTLRAKDTSEASGELKVRERIEKLDKDAQAAQRAAEGKAFNETVRTQLAAGNRNAADIASRANEAITALRRAKGLVQDAPVTPAAPTAPATTPVPTATIATQQAPQPSVEIDEDAAPLISEAEVLSQLEVAPKSAGIKMAVAPDASVDDVVASIPEEHDDVKEMVRTNPNLANAIRGTKAPPVMYHGTRAYESIRELKSDRGQLGTHLSANRRVSDKFAKGSKGGVMRVAAKLTNPLRLIDRSGWDANSVGTQLIVKGLATDQQVTDAVKEQQLIEQDYARRYGDAAVKDNAVALEMETKRNAVTAKLIKDAGYDSVEYLNRFEIPGMTENERRERLRTQGINENAIGRMTDEEFLQVFPEADTSYIALDSSQVKDIDRNNGDFNPRKADTRAATPEVQNRISADQKRRNAEVANELDPETAGYVEAMNNAASPKERVRLTLDFVEDTLGEGYINDFMRESLLPLVRKLSHYISDVNLKLDQELVSGDNGKSQALAYFDPKNNAITAGRRGTNARILLHEMLHATTWGALRDPAYVRNNPQAARAIEGLERARVAVENWIKDGGPAKSGDSGIISRFAKQEGGLVGEDGVVDLDELITYTWTDPAVFRALKAIPVRGTYGPSAWSSIVSAFRNLLGMKPKDQDSLETVLEATLDLISSLDPDKGTQDARTIANSDTFNRTETETSGGAILRGQAVRTAQRAMAAKASKNAGGSTEGTLTKSATEGEESNASDLIDRMSFTQSSLDRASEYAKGERGKLASIKDKILQTKEEAVNKPIAEILARLRSFTSAIEYNAHADARTMTDAMSPEAAQSAELKALFDANTKEKALAAEQAFSAKYPEDFAVYAAARAEVKRASLAIIKALYDASPRAPDGTAQPTSATIKEINAIAANLDNYWNISYQLHNPQLKEQWVKYVKKTAEGRKLQENAVKFIMDDAVNFKVADLDSMPRSRLERIHSLWVNDAVYLVDKSQLISNIKSAVGNGDVLNEQGEAMAANAVNDLLSLDERKAMVRYFNSNRVKRGILEERSKVPPAIAEVMGKISDPLAVVYNTMYQQKRLVAQLEATKEIRDRYTGEYVFETRAQAVAAGVQSPVQFTGATVGALRNMWSSAEAVDLFAMKEASPADALVRGLNKVLGIPASLLRTSNLLLAPATWVANLTSSLNMVVANGHNPFSKDYYDNANTIWKNVLALSSGKFYEDVYDMYRLGLADPVLSADLRELSFSDALKELQRGDVVDKNRAESILSYIKDAKATAGKGIDTLWHMYSGSDLIAKLTVYYKQKRMLIDMNEADSLGWTDKQIEDMAAARTRETTFSYEKAAPVVRMLDRSALTVFSTYQWEAFRSLVASTRRLNEDRKLVQELRASGNNNAANILLQHTAARAAGIAVATGTQSVQTAALAMTVASVLSMIGYGMDGMDDEERRRAQEAINAVSPFYENKHPHLLYKDKDGNYVFMEMGRYTDPYGPITELGSAVLSGEPDRIGRAVSGLGALNPLLSNIGKGVPSVIKNDEEDLQAYEASGMNTPLKNYLANLTVISNPPILKNQLVNIAQGLGIIDDVESIELQEETQADRLVNSVAAPGVKMFTINPVESLGNMYTADFDRARTSMINDRIKGLRSVNEATISELYNDLRLEEQEIIGNHQKLVALARISGATNEQLSDSLKTGNLPRHQQRWLLNPVEANFRTNVLSEDQLNRARSDELKEVTDGEQRRAINLKYAELRRLRLELNKEFNADGT